MRADFFALRSNIQQIPRNKQIAFEEYHHEV
nr:MAG TPA: hypothetical protein [Caudoviricetes sp.]